MQLPHCFTPRARQPPPPSAICCVPTLAPLSLASPPSPALQVRDKVKAGFEKQAALSSEVDIKRAVNRGRYMTREMLAVVQMKKYRTMRTRYMPWE